MKSILQQKRFDFSYNGVPFSKIPCSITETQKENRLITCYTLPDGLKITQTLTWYEEACEWVNHFENPTAFPSGMITDLLDGCVALPLPHEELPEASSWQQDFHKVTQIYAPSGSSWAFDEFSSAPHRRDDVRFTGQLAPNRSRYYATSGGRSSEKHAPFFNIHFQGKGYIAAIGWTGQWNCEIRRREDDVLIKSGIEGAAFRVLPGEKFRTSSLVILPYEGDVITGQNAWRKLVREHFSLIGKEGRDQQAPLCLNIWGGMKSDSVLERLKLIRENGLDFDYLWMDAGWYGIHTAPTPSEFEGDWQEHTGDWRVSPLVHPQGLKDVSEAVHQMGMKFLLWAEPERVIASTPIVQAHPEYFFDPADAKTKNRLLNLGLTEAWDYCYETLAHLIESIGIDCYRQDFNMRPLADWRKHDTPERQGMSEILHINGLYRLWDALLSRFPHLLIDNCASGGRRIDIETLRRSVPLWRSDYACTANFLAEGVQCHHLSFNQWLPYSGTHGGRLYDTYRARSAYSPGMGFPHAFNERESFGEDPEKLAWMRKMIAEYKRVRPLMEEDFYPLTQLNDCTDTWCASQFDRPSRKDGMVQLFRREKSPVSECSFDLGGIQEEALYAFTDADTEESFSLSGKELKEKGFTVRMTEKRSSKIFFYRYE